MPYAAAKPCRKYGCKGYQVENSGYCELHQNLVKRWKRYPTSGPKVHDKAAWQKARNLFRRLHSVCAICGRAAEVVHHIQPIDEGGSPFDFDNMQSLCRTDHERLHGRKR